MTDGYRRVMSRPLPGLFEAEETMKPMREPTSSADAVRRVLTTAGIAGATLTLSAAAALPALACHGGGGSGSDGDHSKQGSSSQSSHKHDSHDTGSDDSGATKTSSEHSDKGKSDQGDDSHGEKSQGGSTEGHNPPGNNGTVKIHQTAGDSSPHNQPHVTCSFYVSFFGFDKNQTMDVSFAGQAPTGKDVAIPVSTTTSKTSTTDAGGAGNDYDGDLGVFDASNMDLSVLGAPAKQGYHIKLDVATHEPGGHKYKVFWFSPCGSTPGGTTGGTGDTGGTTDTGGDTGGGTVAGETAGQGTTSVLGESFTKGATAAGAPAGAQVLGASASRGGSAGLASLPFTGAEVGAMSALGLAALGGGTALMVAGRRRRRPVQSH